MFVVLCGERSWSWSVCLGIPRSARPWGGTGGRGTQAGTWRQNQGHGNSDTGGTPGGQRVKYAAVFCAVYPSTKQPAFCRPGQVAFLCLSFAIPHETQSSIAAVWVGRLTGWSPCWSTWRLVWCASKRSDSDRCWLSYRWATQQRPHHPPAGTTCSRCVRLPIAAGWESLRPRTAAYLS